MGAAERPLLSYFEKAPPLAAIAVVQLSGVDVEIKADPKFTKDSLPALSVPGGWAFLVFELPFRACEILFAL
jgi:hypothetical protein